MRDKALQPEAVVQPFCARPEGAEESAALAQPFRLQSMVAAPVAVLYYVALQLQVAGCHLWPSLRVGPVSRLAAEAVRSTRREWRVVMALPESPHHREKLRAALAEEWFRQAAAP